MNKLTKRQRRKLHLLQEEHYNKTVLCNYSMDRLRQLQDLGRAPKEWLERYEKDIDSFYQSVLKLQAEIEDMIGVPYTMEAADMDSWEE